MGTKEVGEVGSAAAATNAVCHAAKLPMPVASWTGYPAKVA
ncbi:hypothetical protein [Nonomuraea cavernae]